MINISRDYNWRDGPVSNRFTQYQCPKCQSYDVTILRLADINDGQSGMMIGKGDMGCHECKLVAKGYDFEVYTYSERDIGKIELEFENHIKKTGDRFVDGRFEKILSAEEKQEMKKSFAGFFSLNSD